MSPRFYIGARVKWGTMAPLVMGNDDNPPELALQHAEALNRGLIEAVPGGFVHVLIDGSIHAANREALRILGLSYDELTSKYTADFEPETIFEDGSPCGVEEYPVTKALMTGEPQPAVTIGVRRPDGQVSWAVFRAVPVKGPDAQVSGAVVTFLDISERKQDEEYLRHAQRMESIGQLAAGVAHDFNNLLQVMLSNLDLAASEQEPQEELISEMRTAAERGAALTRQLLTFGHRQPFKPVRLPINEVAGSLTALMQRMLGERVELSFDADEEVGAVLGDQGQLEQVLINLCINARDAMPEGGAIRVATRRVNDPDELRQRHLEPSDSGYVEVLVEDRGAGMSADVQARAFEPFFTTKPAGTGTGLGLSVVYGIVQRHGGTVALESRRGHGTTVRFFLPLSSVPARVVEPRESDAAPGGNERILIVEDEAPVRRLVARIVAGAGYEVATAASGQEALTLARDDDGIALVISDLVMPGMQGRELARHLHETRPGLPVLFVSGYAGDEEGPQREDEDVLYKPFKAEALLKRLRELLDGG